MMGRSETSLFDISIFDGKVLTVILSIYKLNTVDKILIRLNLV